MLWLRGIRAAAGQVPKLRAAYRGPSGLRTVNDAAAHGRGTGGPRACEEDPLVARTSGH